MYFAVCFVCFFKAKLYHAPILLHDLACYTSILHKIEESDPKTKEENNIIVVFGSLKIGIKDSQKEHICKEITTGVSSVGVDNRSPADGSIFNLHVQPRYHK